MPFPKVSFSVVPKRLTSSRVSCARAGNSYDSSEMCKQESQRFSSAYTAVGWFWRMNHLEILLLLCYKTLTDALFLN